MATEQEELKLIVSLVDNASPGLDKIIEKTKEMGGPSGQGTPRENGGECAAA
jgi:hypothetical protein